MAAPKGGKRLGAGRKPGGSTKRTQQIVEAAMAEGISPLEYMLQIMRTEETFGEDARVMHDQRVMRFEAAKAAAPYIHPRLAAIEHTGVDGGSIDHSLTVSFVGQ